ncbi:MAG: gamma-glutamyl-gamma-aminobutyrate hydrolase family protein, partial [Spirochaetaceae bacterium]|nr:gamma-glutamyl-gamma-aminobutyrate hydrolase family protein [Spirochaetaceae bacterium]
MEKILILDFGSQTTALIGRRVREMGVYSEIVPGDDALTASALAGVRGIILSGSPESVYASGAAPDRRLYECGLPLLGICYGLQRMTVDLGGVVRPLPKREYGRVSVTLDGEADGLDPQNQAARDVVRAALGKKFTAWMSHGDTLTTLAPGFVQVGTSASGYPALVFHREEPWFGVQFHPEVTHCERGNELLAAFVQGVCRCAKSWTMEGYAERAAAELRERADGKPVLLLISGGVDSTVAGALLLSALGGEQVHLMYLDTGLMRKNETQAVRAGLERLGAKHLHIIHCEDEFLGALFGVAVPEDKRTIIGDLFIRIQEREVARLKLPTDYFLAQGTLYTDLIESGKGVGKQAHVIKSHHNVASPLVDAKRRAGKILEPLDKLYKDEV